MTEQDIKRICDSMKNVGFVDGDVKIVNDSLEKQIPKKPKIVEADMDGMDMETGEEYTYKIDEAHCNCCDFIVGADDDIFCDYCPNCGQKIDWSCWE